MKQMPYTSEMSTGVGVIDQQQKALVNKLNSALELCELQKHTAQEQLAGRLRALQIQALEGFLVEENLMWTFNYQSVNSHQDSHRELWATVNEIMNDLPKPQTNVPQRIIALTERASRHFQVEDRLLADHLLSLAESTSDDRLARLIAPSS